jgi:magnesium transporter
MNFEGKDALQHVFKRLSTKAGSAPGTLMHIGEKRVDNIRISVVNYDQDSIDERLTENLSKALSRCEDQRTTWLNIDGLHDTEIISRLGDHFQIHPLTLEDILNTAQRAKKEDFDSYLFVVLKMLRYVPESGEILHEQISLIITKRILISFQESQGDVFDPVRQRLRINRGRIRKNGCDYLAYALVDAIVDHYYTILEHVGTQIDRIEEEILDAPGPDVMERLHDLKRHIIYLRKQIWPLREVINSMAREENPLIKRNTTLFFRDVHDHTVQVIDTIESYRDLMAGLLDLYLTIISNRMNEVMKVLTIIATIFIPITFIAGVYGMNFKYMPELEWTWGYGLIWFIMVAMAVVMLIFFKRKKWL